MSYPSDLEYPRRVVVDDTDPRIKYEQGSWTVDNNSFDSITILGTPYNGTQHGTASTTASFSFQFEGEFVQVRGTKDNRKITRPEGTTSDNSTQLAKWTCQVDGGPIKTTPYRPYMLDVTHNMLCEQGKLSHGPHTLTLNVTIGNPNTQMFWLDKIEYVPPPDADLTKEVMKFDSSDPSIQIDNNTGAWKTTGTLFNATWITGASASFNFNGSSVSCYGFNEGLNQYFQPSTGRYYIDNKGDTSFDISGSETLPGPEFPTNRSGRYNQLWFTASNIEPGSHELVLTFMGLAKGSGPFQPLSIDYFYVTNGEDSSSSGISSSRTNAGAIAGGVVGAVIGSVLIGLAVLLKRRQANKNRPGLRSTSITPYSVASPVASKYASPNYNKASDTVIPTQSPMVVDNPHVSFHNQIRPNAKNTTAIERQHGDSGIRYPQLVDLPPIYTEL